MKRYLITDSLDFWLIAAEVLAKTIEGIQSLWSREVCQAAGGATRCGAATRWRNIGTSK
jgi:hypothetical protein